ncbi:isocitrate lyase/PEP mutase family protein [Chengkuizengella sediminis]|uniref:isocitrate lyase/PEP mutase family protein n=1 Tax=Chengkuizengella sediminis TaxID=1885917 RepID=UPI00138A4A06|nr:isocitrate lyase/phosphoenolpyruvate mutase family protein [Chengkuizengella sediminis]NDI34841.1 isocitrate lyase/phosphoenolpyruvate mutase family protein [Chengkuizengella sediminis]
MITQLDKANLLNHLHIKGDPLILFNIWDAGSAQAIQSVGSRVIATGSWSVAAAHGYADGEKLPFDLVLANLKRIIASVDLPVTIDLEGGYSQNLTKIQENVTKVIEAGAVGINFEDQIVGGKGLYSIEEQCNRIKAVRDAAERASIPIFINARADIFLNIEPVNHNNKHLEEAILRASAYAEFGASGFFAPGLRNAKYIGKLCELSPIPVNIMVLPDTPPAKKLAELGVARISHGPGPYAEILNTLKETGRKALSMS